MDNKSRYTGESYGEILAYWLPEMISIFIITALPPLVDAYLIAGLKSELSYGALGLATNLTHMLIKLSEAIPVASIAIIGRYNGAKKYNKCGEGFISTFWTTCLLGITQLSILWFGATSIYRWLGVPEEMVPLGAPLLKLRAVSVFLAFLLWAFVGFMRAVKNTKTPMTITLLGTVTFLFFDVLFITGMYGFPKLGIYGSPLASIMQYSVMLLYAIYYLFSEPEYKKYFEKIKSYITHKQNILTVLWLGLPVMIDKASISFSYVWLSKMIAPLGTQSIAAFDMIKNLERSAIMPAAAFAQVITFLVSNRLGSGEEKIAKKNIKRVLFLTLGMVSCALSILWIYAPFFIARISPSPEITQFAIPLLRTLSLFVVFDFLQLILAGALRGAGQVHIVMWGRFITCFFFFIPLSKYISGLTFSNISVKFGLLYGAFYINTALMGLVFFAYIIRKNWYRSQV